MQFLPATRHAGFWASRMIIFQQDHQAQSGAQSIVFLASIFYKVVYTEVFEVWWDI